MQVLPESMVAYEYTYEEKRALDTLLQSPLLASFIQTKRTGYVVANMLQPLENFQVGDVDSNFGLSEAYLKGALDAFNELITPILPPPTEDNEGEHS